MYELSASATLLVHFIFIIFVSIGSLLFYYSSKVIIYHFLSLIWGFCILITHSTCPLTYLENWFLKKANLETYSEGFIQNYLVQIVYPDDLTDDTQIKLAVSLLLLNVIIYSLYFRRAKSKKLKERFLNSFTKFRN